MSLFTGSSGFTINGGNFSINLATPEPAEDSVSRLQGKRKERGRGGSDADRIIQRRRCSSRSSDGLMTVRVDEVDLRRELVIGNSYRMYSASHHGRVVAIKVFEGPRANQDWRATITFSKKFLHSNVLKIVGASDESSEKPFVIFHGIAEKKLQPMIAKALRTDLNMSVQLSMKAVKGLAAGLSYVKSQRIPIMNSLGWESFDILAGDDNEVILAIHPPSTTFDIESDSHGIETLNRLCQKLFSEANSILYDDSPEREFDPRDTESLSKDFKSTAEITESGAMSTKCKDPRREVWWRLGIGAPNRSLDSVARRFEDHLDCFISTSSNSPLRRIRATKDTYSRRNLHRCPGYLREEITLTADVSKSAIISHAYPSQRELCSICGELVLYADPVSNSNPLIMPPNIHDTEQDAPAAPSNASEEFLFTFLGQTSSDSSRLSVAEYNPADYDMSEYSLGPLFDISDPPTPDPILDGVDSEDDSPYVNNWDFVISSPPWSKQYDLPASFEPEELNPLDLLSDGGGMDNNYDANDYDPPDDDPADYDPADYDLADYEQPDYNPADYDASNPSEYDT